MKRLLPLLLALLTVAACSRTEPRIHRQDILAFGTLITVSIYTDDDRLAEQGFQALQEDFRLMHEAWHAWHPGSLMRFNGLARTGGWFSAGPSVLALIEQARPLAEQSEQLFNPAIGELIAAWGFHRDEGPAGPPPSGTWIRDYLQHLPTLNDLEIRGVRVRGHNPRLQLDFGAFAKGYGVDRALERLKSFGIENALINAGGDLKGMGRPGDRPWKIAIRDPRAPDAPLATLELQGEEAVFTSGGYERGYEYRGRRYHHIIDPRTGRPARGTLSVTVIHPLAATADAAATALFIAGPRDWPRIARRMGIREVLLVAEDGHIEMTPQMAARVHFLRPPQPAPTIIDPFAAVTDSSDKAAADGYNAPSPEQTRHSE
ncbi:MAG: FAD:protein FMN transferase [Gammaproteobacteria bacterium]|nr:MAG: FAD:protein FMN transferase [Gammaproteobacteria bacterium]